VTFLKDKNISQLVSFLNTQKYFDKKVIQAQSTITKFLSKDDYITKFLIYFVKTGVLKLDSRSKQRSSNFRKKFATNHNFFSNNTVKAA